MPLYLCLYPRYQYSTLVSVNDDHWHHLAVSWNEHGGNLIIYTDGHVVQNQHLIRPGRRIDSGGKFTLGEIHGSGELQIDYI